MVDNGRVDTAEYVLRLMKTKGHIEEIGKILGKLANDVKLEIVFDIICVSANRNHSVNIATASSMLHDIANEGKINVVAEIINQMVCGEDTDNAIKVLVYRIRCREETAARKIINEISDAKRIDIISKLLLRLENMTFKDHDLSAANELKQMLEQAQNCVKIKIIKDINDHSLFAIADMIIKILNRPDIKSALLIFQAIDKTKRPNVLSAMKPNNKIILYNILKERNTL